MAELEPIPTVEDEERADEDDHGEEAQSDGPSEVDVEEPTEEQGQVELAEELAAWTVTAEEEMAAREAEARAAWERRPHDPKKAWKPPAELEWERVWKWSKLTEREKTHQAWSWCGSMETFPAGVWRRWGGSWLLWR